MIKNIILSLCIILSLWSVCPIAANTQPVSLLATDIIRLDRNYQPAVVGRHLSIAQQAQILSDVQQHEHQFNVPVPSLDQATMPITTFAKNNVDRTKNRNVAQSLYYHQQQQHHLADYISQQKNPIYFQTTKNPLLTQTLRQRKTLQHPQWGIQQSDQYHTQHRGDTEGLQKDILPLSNNDQEVLLLKHYFEKQQGLDLLQRQRIQLLIDRQELKKQQQLLKLQELQNLSTVRPFTTQKPNVISATTPSSILTTPTTKKITRAETELFLMAIEKHKQKFSSATSTMSPFISINKSSNVTSNQNSEKQTNQTLRKSNSNLTALKGDKLSSNIRVSNVAAVAQSKPQIGIIFSAEKAPGEHKKYTTKTSSEQATLPLTFASKRDTLLKQLTVPLSRPSVDDAIKKLSVGDPFPSNEEELPVPRTPYNLTTVVDHGTKVTTTTIKPPKTILEELTKEVLPPGTDFEVIRHKGDGSLEDLGKLPIQNIHSARVTFVVLEEQPNGSYKIQGIKGNSENGSESDVRSIVDKIKSGELKLPPSALRPQNLSTSIPIPTETVDVTSVIKPRDRLSTHQLTANENSFSTPENVSTTRFVNHVAASRNSSKLKGKSSVPYVTAPSSFIPSTEYYVTSTTTPGETFNASFPSLPMRTVQKTSTTQLVNVDAIKYSSFTGVNSFSTVAPISKTITTISYTPVSSTLSNQSSNRLHNSKLISLSSPRSIINTSKAVALDTSKADDIYEGKFQNSLSFSTISPTTQLGVKCQTNCQEDLLKVLKRKGFFAMAKFLKQSGLDDVLNETGPYTIFVPTDKAFRSLLVQLGGPEEAEQKFQDNPRLLSGLLLHHVIPGSFMVDSLLDEMTGVSLAGTQLRVNAYNMQDHEWNTVKITTINGAKILPEKRDIEITQGVIQSIDRVMFPLPVGDLIQTMLADREARFTTFIEMLRASGIADSLSGSKTFTVFAPTNAAFIATRAQSGHPLWTDVAGAESAKAIVSRYIVPTTLYTAGMNYYQQKNTIESRTTIHIHKNNGRIRVNDAQLLTPDVPATNGVLHAIDALL